MAGGHEADARYAEILGQLFVARRGGVDLGLSRMRACLAALHLKRRPLATIQVAGTNGKGSTCAFLARVLSNAGYRVGVYGSPHLQTVRERIRIGDDLVSKAQFIAAHEAAEAAHPGLTFFEVLTAMAAWCFDQGEVDVAIYEVGLGGRLDSTTAIDSTLSIVTGIGNDHAEFLGETLSEIALEKAGIFRAGVPAVIGLSAPEEIRALLVAQAERPVLVDESHLAAVPALALRGEHQRRNAACAVAAVEALRSQGIAISNASLRSGLAEAQMPGRLTELAPGLWMDGAHNEQAARALCEALAPMGPVALVVGLSSTKNPDDVLAPLRSCGAVVVATGWPSDRALDTGRVAEAAQRLGFETVLSAPSPMAAVQLAQGFGAPVVLTGSLLMLGAYLDERFPDRADPVALTDPSHKPSGQTVVH